jgi:hypothetical protein
MNGQVRMTTRFRELVFMVALTVPGALAVGCDATRRNWGTCFKESCHDGFACVSNRCVPASDGGPWDANPPDTRQGIDGATSPSAMDGSPVDLSFTIDAGDDVPVSVASVDGAAELDTATEAGSPVFVDAGAVDAYVPDAPGTCASDNDCTGQGAPYCVQGQCVSCKTGDQCNGGAPICSLSHACVSCAVVDAGCPAATPACEADSGRCLECLGDGDCVRDATKSFCQAGLCVGCTAAGASACAVRNLAQPVCLPGGTCAECATSDDCKAAAKPICDTSANVCVACTSDVQCSGAVGGPGVCMFQQDGHCATDAESIYVGKNGAGTCSDSGAGTAQMPYCTTKKAMEAAKPVVVVMGQVQGPLVVGALSSSLTVVGRSGIITPVDYADGITITGGELYLRALTVAGNPSGVTGIGINAHAATGATVTLYMNGCTVRDNPGGGILLAGAAFEIRNSTITGNGPGQTPDGVIWGGIRVDSLPPTGQTSLDMVTIQNNPPVGLTCAGLLQGQGVLASGNTPLDIATSCGVVSCATPSSTCGAQP